MEMNHGNMIQITLGTQDLITTPAIYQYDHGMALRVAGVTQNQISEAHIGVESIDQAYNLLPIQYVGGLQFPIPDILLILGKDVHIYLYIETDDFGYTVCHVHVPVVPRKKPDHISMDDPYYEQLNQLARELERLIAETEIAKQSAEGYAVRAEDAATDALAACDRAEQIVDTLDPDKIENQISALKTVLDNFITVDAEGWYTADETIRAITSAEIDQICV